MEYKVIDNEGVEVGSVKADSVSDAISKLREVISKRDDATEDAPPFAICEVIGELTYETTLKWKATKKC